MTGRGLELEVDTGLGPVRHGIAARLTLSEAVRDAAFERRPIVALESTLISHGLPYPKNLEVARAAEAAVRHGGATPATIAIRGGRILVGLEDIDLQALAHAEGVLKAARPSLAEALALPGWAATTVSATMIAAHAAGIDVFATGGIGGVHRGALDGARAAATEADAGPGGTVASPRSQPTFDISSDLEELARTPMAVVCAGPKAVLDVAATLEYLETRGVPVIAVGIDDVPGFYSRSSGIRALVSVADVQAAASLVRLHLELGLGSAALVCVPVPVADAVPEAEVAEAVARAVADAGAAGIHGPELTPWLLARVGDLTAGASVRANTALIVNDAAAAAELAVALRQPEP